jgi:DNA-binding response OmpR family regulator
MTTLPHPPSSGSFRVPFGPPAAPSSPGYDAAAAEGAAGAVEMAQAPDQPVLLLVDDEPELRTLLGEYFGRHGFAVRSAADAAAARAQLAQQRPQLAILDVNMPGENGLSLARWMREAHPGVAIVMLTTAGEAVDRIVGLELGADDYVSKPFELRELLARVRAVLRRLQTTQAGATAATPAVAANSAAAARQVRFGGCTLDLDTRRLFGAEGQEIEITAAEFDLLSLFGCGCGARSKATPTSPKC